MERMFSARWQDRAACVFMLFVCAGTIGFGIYFPFARHYDASEQLGPWIGTVVFCAMGFGLGAFLVWGLIESCTTYSVDGLAITRKGLFQTQTLPFREIAFYRTRGAGRRAVYDLTDIFGAKMTVYLGMVPNGADIGATLETALADLRRSKTEEFERTGFASNPRPAQISAAAFIALCGLGFIATAVYLVTVPQSTTSPVFVWIVSVAGGAMGVLFIGTGLYLGTWRFKLSNEGIEQGSIFGSKTVPFGDVQSMVSRDVTTKNGTWNTTTVRSNGGKRIQFTEAMPNYADMLAFIHTRVPDSAIEAGNGELPKIERKQFRTSLVVSVVVLVLSLAISSWYVARAYEYLNRQLDYERHGVQGLGRVVGKHTETHNKSDLYVVDFEFADGGKRFQGHSPVYSQTYDQALVGEQISIVYLPNNPSRCRAVQSIGKRIAIGDLIMGGIYLALSIAGSISLGRYCRKNWQAIRATSRTQQA